MKPLRRSMPSLDLAELTERVVRDEAARRGMTVAEYQAHVEAFGARLRLYVRAWVEQERQARRGRVRGRPS